MLNCLCGFLTFGLVTAPAADLDRGQGRALTVHPRKSWPIYRLRAESVWHLELPEGNRFDASGLLVDRGGQLLTINDRGASLYRINWPSAADDGSVRLSRLENLFTEDQLAPLAERKFGRYDCEGIAQDSVGRIYICEEGDRWILRADPRSGQVARLEIDWSPVERFFNPADRNASFEGIAVGDGILYVANERNFGRIIEVDLQAGEVNGSFVVHPWDSNARDVHYSDLAWHNGSLYVLLRQSACVLKVDPERRTVLAEYQYGIMEQSSEVRFNSIVPLGLMEGLAVEDRHIWLVTDNNGWARARDSQDRRPVLFRCVRPDAPDSRAPTVPPAAESGER